MSAFTIPAGTRCRTRRSDREPWADHVTPAPLHLLNKQRWRNDGGHCVFRLKDGRWLQVRPDRVVANHAGRSPAEAARRRAGRGRPADPLATAAAGFGLFVAAERRDGDRVLSVYDSASGRAAGWFVPATGRYKLHGRTGVEKDVRAVFGIARAG